jgi:transcriptional regulator with XRE-family HTH domain
MERKTAVLEIFGARVRERRRVLGYSQEELGFRAGFDRTYISGIEQGKRNPSLLAIVTLAAGLQMTGAELLEGCA